MQLTAPEQLWVSDIMYLKTREDNCYLTLIADAWSRRFVGYAVHDNMETDSMIVAYQMALKEKQHPHIRTVHHSDRGLQYCRQQYVALSQKHGCNISITEYGAPMKMRWLKE